MTNGQITYDLRRLRAHGLIERIPSTHHYQVTDPGLRHTLFLTRTYTRLLRTGLAEIHDPPLPSTLRTARPRLRNRHHQPHQNSRPHSLNPTRQPQT
jgi:hypothetical protein